MLGHGVRCIFLTAPLSYAAVALSFGQYEKRLGHGKLATSYILDLLPQAYVSGNHLAQFGKGTDDLDVHLDCSWTVEYA